MTQISRIVGWGLIGIGALLLAVGFIANPHLLADLYRVLRLTTDASVNPGWLVVGLVLALCGTIVARGKATPLLWPVAALALLLIYNLVFSRSFFDLKVGVDMAVHETHYYGSLIDIFKSGAVTMLLALGMTLVIATGGIDLSVGAVIAIAGCVAGSFIQPEKESLFYGIHIAQYPFLIVAFALLAGLLCGAWNGFLVSFVKVQPIIATLILMIAGRGLAQLITGGAKPTYGDYPVMDFIGKHYLGGIQVQILIAVAAATCMLLLTRTTALGLYVETIGNNAATAEVAGIHAQWVRFFAYALTGVLAASAGVMKAAELRYPDYNAGVYSELEAIVAVAIGGTSLVGGRFSIIGSLLGALIMQALRSTLLFNQAGPALYLILQASVVLAICLLQSELLRTYALRLLRLMLPRKPASTGASA